MEISQLKATDGVNLHLYYCMPAGAPHGLIYLAHGMGEHARRYAAVMQALAAAGFVVVTNDHRGHGEHCTALGDFGPDGWPRVLADTREIIAHWQTLYPNCPLILMGHSMGAMVVQQCLLAPPLGLSAVVLSGSAGRMPPLLYRVFLKVLAFEHWRTKGGDSPLLAYLLFGSFNRAFSKQGQRTGFEWLSRDDQSVARYHLDPFCGRVPNSKSLLSLFSLEAALWQQPLPRNLKPGLPVYLLSGAADPVHAKQANLTRLIDWLQGLGARVDADIYPEARHEVLNETNRDEVISKLIDWLQVHNEIGSDNLP
ncbi:alpha/beta hydrolase [Pseudomonadales bacterium]|nr:alpha/beta hydrolase [Pseudomonadales bacterium]